jgi:hypothetical protein
MAPVAEAQKPFWRQWGGLTPSDRLNRIADRLGKLPAGSMEADSTIHDALGLAGAVLPYSREEVAARGLLPTGFEWLPVTYSGSGGTVFAACRRSRRERGWPHTHHGQWGHTLPLALCGATMRARATLAKD